MKYNIIVVTIRTDVPQLTKMQNCINTQFTFTSESIKITRIIRKQHNLLCTPTIGVCNVDKSVATSTKIG